MRFFLKAITALLMGYLFLGFVALPPLIHLTITQLAPRFLQGSIQVGAVHVNPITLKITVHAVDIGDTVGFSSLTADIAWSSLRHQNIHIESIRLDKPYGIIETTESGDLNLTKLLLHQDSENSSNKEQAAYPTIQLDHLQINSGNIQLKDEQINSGKQSAFEAEISQLSLSASNINWPETNSKVVLSGQLNNQAMFSVSGSFLHPEPATTMDITLTDFPLEILQPYLETDTYLEVKGGHLSGRASLNWQEQQGFISRGDININDFQLSDSRNQSTIGYWSDLQLKNIEFHQHNAQLHIRNIQLTSPFLKLAFDEQFNANLSGLVKEHKEPARDNVPQKNSLPINIAIDSVEIVNGSMDFSDRSFDPGFSAPISALNGQFSSITIPEKHPVNVNIEGQADRYSPVLITGKINPLNLEDKTNISISFDNIELTTLTPYSGRFAGYAINKGRMDLNLDYQTNNGVLSAQNQMVLEHLQLGNKIDSDEAVDMPIKLALALLKDDDGRIDIRLPVTGSLDNPDFSIGPAIRTALVNMLKNTISAPFDLLATLTGGRAHEMKNISFAPGQTTLAADQLPALKQLAQGLSKRPDLELDIMGMASRDTDWPILTLQLVNEQLNNLWQHEISAQDQPGKIKRIPPIPKRTKTRILRQLAKDMNIATPHHLTGPALDLHWTCTGAASPKKLAV